MFRSYLFEKLLHFETPPFAFSSICCRISTVSTHIFALWWLVLGLANGVRAVMAFFLTPALQPYDLSIPLPFLGGLYALWCVLCLIVCAAVWLRWPIRRWTLPAAVAYQITLWALRIFAYRSDYARSLWIWHLILTVLFLGMMYIFSRKVRITNYE